MLCVNSSHVLLVNGTCATRANAQESSYNALTNGSADSSVVSNNLINYFESLANSSVSVTSLVLTIGRVDEFVENLNNTGFNVSRSSSFLMVQERNGPGNLIVLGASFKPDVHGEVVNSQNRDGIINSNLSSAAIVGNESISNIRSLKMLIIEDPVLYKNIDNSTDNKSLVSAVIVASVEGVGDTRVSVNISLYFKPSPGSPADGNGTFLCSFYDTNTSRWSERGCSSPQYNQDFGRYECSCNHTTSFALIWLPPSLLESYGRTLRPADIASLVSQSLSIVCFLGIMVHIVFSLRKDEWTPSKTYDLLSLISSASTTSLFILYIALTVTVYTRTTSENETQCFLSSSILMFLVYFFLIFMFCAKTSVSLFSYVRFIRLFPEPSKRKLSILLFTSFFVSMAWVSFAIGFNSNSSYNISRFYPYRLCWFTPSALWYFLTIPVGIFLVVNAVIIICVGKRIVTHVRNATTRHDTYERMKRCVLVLLSSCVTQGIGWLFGPFLTLANPSAGYVLEWFFIVFNGLEGVWTVILYWIIRSEKVYDGRRADALKQIKKMIEDNEYSPKKTLGSKDRERSSIRTKENEIKRRDRRKESASGFGDGYDNIVTF